DDEKLCWRSIDSSTGTKEILARPVAPSDFSVPTGGLLPPLDRLPNAVECHHAISCYRSVVCISLDVRGMLRRRRSRGAQERRQGALSIDRLPGDHLATRVDLHGQSEAAELWASAGAPHAVSVGCSDGLERYVDRGWPTGGGGSADNQCQRVV